MIASTTPPSDWPAEQTYRGLINYQNNQMGISRKALNDLRTHLPFTQLRFHCGKQKGRTFHVITASNSTGEAVLQYFSGQTALFPDSCGSFVPMEDDNSILTAQCDKWGHDNGKLYVGKWGTTLNRVLYDHACFVGFTAHWIVGVGGRWECDDYNKGVSLNDFWRIYVR